MATFNVLALPAKCEANFSELVVHAGNEKFVVHIPAIKGLVYSVTTIPFKKITLESDFFEIRRVGPIKDILQKLKSFFLTKRKRKLKFGPFIVTAKGTKASRKIFYSILKRLRNTGTPLDGRTFDRFPEILNGWKGNPDYASTRGRISKGNVDGPSVAIVVHMYYRDVWPQVAAALNAIQPPFDLIITTSPSMDGLVSDILRDFPTAEIKVYPNRGRDVRPFLMLLEEGRLDKYKYICKIHGKKSNDHGRDGILGDIWRNQLLFDLLAAPGILDQILRMFEANNTLGIIGSKAYRFPNLVCEAKHAWGNNRELVLELAQKIGDPRYELDFFAGTMFWIRPEAMAPLRNLSLASKFIEECGRVDGALEHAIERLFIASAKSAGFTAQAVNAADL